jgi:hypothetical protein
MVVDPFIFISPFVARNEQLTGCIGETAGLQSENPVIKTGCLQKGICANVVLSAVTDIPFTIFL